MYLDESPIFPGDQVYDLLLGAGTVEKLLPSENRFIVQFGARVVGYRQNGTGPYTTRTLYWHNPIMGAPPKDSAAFGFYRELCVNLSKFCAEQQVTINKLLESNNGA